MDTLKIAMNGVTGRMGYGQHLTNAILPIRDEGGVVAPDGRRLPLEPILVGRQSDRLRDIAEQHDIARWTTDVDSALSDADIYFDAQATPGRAEALSKAMTAGKHVFAEKPSAETSEEAFALARLQGESGVAAGIVHHMLYLPGLSRLQKLVTQGFFGRVVSARIEFGYWVFDGDGRPAQRPSWNYRSEDGGGITADMFTHLNYILERIIAPVREVHAVTATHLPQRWNEQRQRYAATADDAVYSTLVLDGDIVAVVSASWASRMFRDEILQIHIDGTAGSAVAGFQRCVIQPVAGTPVMTGDTARELQDERGRWLTVPDQGTAGNPFRAQWEEYLQDVVAGRSHENDLNSGARGVQLAELAHRSSEEGRRLAVPKGSGSPKA